MDLGGVRPRGQLHEPAWLGTLSLESQAESAASRAPKKSLSDAAEFAHRLAQRLDIIASVAADGRELRLWFEDEARFGLHLSRYRRLTARGVKPCQPFEPIYDSSWLYGAVEPATGESFFLQLPYLDAECFTVFIEHLSKHAPDALNVVVIDNAPAHIKRTLVVAENIVLLALPPYSPELNPVERLWLAIRQRIDVFDAAVRSSIDALEEHVAEIVRALTPQQIASLTGYDYILDALNLL